MVPHKHAAPVEDDDCGNDELQGDADDLVDSDQESEERSDEGDRDALGSSGLDDVVYFFLSQLYDDSINFCLWSAVNSCPSSVF